MSSRAQPPDGNGDSTYPIDVGAEIRRKATVKAVEKRLRKRLVSSDDLPKKPKLVLTAKKLARARGGPAAKHNPADKVTAAEDSQSAASQGEPIPAPRLGPGRPGWTRDRFEKHWREAVEATPEPRTFAALAVNFKAFDGTVGGVGGDQLGRLRRKRFPD
jgi:hypothetical protein